LKAGITGQSVILLLGGLFLIYKEVKLERSRKKGLKRKELGKAQQNHFKMCFMIDLVSLLTVFLPQLSV
jgi:threonine/homoserine/homoserine lactone efflux protein